jgi:DNA-binding CsgD family transcriptional regulator
MQTGNSVIIHGSPILQQGFKSILLSRNIGITDVMVAVPEDTVLNTWKNMLIMVDTQFSDEIKKHAKVIKKNGNRIVGIETAVFFNKLDSCFDDILYVHDNLDTINQTLMEYVSGVSDVKSDNQLSHREIEVLTMVAQGYSNKQIADQLFISIHTVITHRKNITFKLGIKSIPGLTLYAALNNLVDFQR